MNMKGAIRPMPFLHAAAVACVVALMGILAFYGLRPALEERGLDQYSAYFFSLSFVFIALILWTAIAYVREGGARSLHPFLCRTRTDRFRPAVIPWSIAIGLLMLLSTLLFSPLTVRLVTTGLLPLPSGLPNYIDPSALQSLPAIRAQLVSSPALPLIPIVLVLNVLSEELFWRGMILPRQELLRGKVTFLVHGFLWALTHVFQYWLLLPILIGSIALAFGVQRTKNTWVGVIAHAINNAFPLAILLLVLR
jgi:membrane protease YdiL (CAAX protease family)